MSTSMVSEAIDYFCVFLLLLLTLSLLKLLYMSIRYYPQDLVGLCQI